MWSYSEKSVSINQAARFFHLLGGDIVAQEIWELGGEAQNSFSFSPAHHKIIFSFSL